MAQSAAATVSTNLPIRIRSYVKELILGGAVVLFDPETSPLVKSGKFRELGNMEADSGISFDPGVKSVEFKQPQATGVNVIMDKPVIEMSPKLTLKLNAPTQRAIGLAMFGGDPNTYAQTAISNDTQTVHDGSGSTALKLGAWYQLTNNGVPVHNITKHIASKDVSGTFTDLVAGSDYNLDTESGMIQYLAGGTNALAGTEKISNLFQAAAIAGSSDIAIAAQPSFVFGGLYIVRIFARNAERAAQTFADYYPRCRVEPTGKFDMTSTKPAEITLDCYPVPTTELGASYPFGYAMRQLTGTMRSIV